jgi:bifunctional DNA-binding transcriptional regulator/antitoxin component of YhaV-PrlF toxin-antitoxin module
VIAWHTVEMAIMQMSGKMKQEMDVRIAANGRMVLPRTVRDALGVEGAGVVVLSVEGDQVKLSSMRQSLKRAQALYRAHATNDKSSDDFVKERRKEAIRENTKLKRS